MHLAYVTWSPSPEEWQICIPERPLWRVVVTHAVESVCAATNHRICASGWAIRLMNLIHYRNKILTVPITAEQAAALEPEFVERVISEEFDC